MCMSICVTIQNKPAVKKLLWNLDSGIVTGPGALTQRCKC